MAFETTEENIRKAEDALGRRFPSALRERLAIENGGEVEAADDVWQLSPVQDMTDRKRMARTANHVVRETAEARKWAGFPQAAIAIATNGGGDCLVLQTADAVPGLNERIFLWRHEDASLTPVDVRWHG